MKHNVKNYLNWIIKTNKNLIPYDRYFVDGKKANNNQLQLELGVHDYAFYYISQLLIINLYEFLNLLHRWKFEQKKSRFKIKYKEFKNKLKLKFDINYLADENRILINKIVSSSIFAKRKQTIVLKGKIVNVNESLYEILSDARNEIAHADYSLMSTGRLDGINKLGDVLDILSSLIN